MTRFRLIPCLFLCSLGHASPDDGWSPLLANECETPEPAWIWCEDFEIDRSSDYFEGSANRQPDTGVAGSTAAAFEFQAGEQSGGGFKVAFGRTPDSYFKPVDDGTADYREVYWRLFVYFPSDWVGFGGSKLTRATVFANSGWAQAMIGHVWSGGNSGPSAPLLLLDPASGTNEAGSLQTTGYNDFDNLRWLGVQSSQYEIFAPENRGKWHCVEVRVRLNDAGAENGIFQLFINDNLEAGSSTLNWLGNYDEYGINAVLFENYWNSGSPVTQTRFFDNLVISTQRIGCGGDVIRPNPPENLRTDS